MICTAWLKRIEGKLKRESKKKLRKRMKRQGQDKYRISTQDKYTGVVSETEDVIVRPPAWLGFVYVQCSQARLVTSLARAFRVD